jgi:hypothetical protein
MVDFENHLNILLDEFLFGSFYFYYFFIFLNFYLFFKLVIIT